MSLSHEQPPLSIDEDLREYLIRRFIDIDNLLDRAGKFPPRKEMPYKPQIGDVHYFGDPSTHNYDAVISMAGFWGLTAFGWRYLGSMHYGLEVCKGNVPGTSVVDKFGRCIDNVDSGVATDIWDGASAGIGTITWVAPTQARIHNIVSTSANDAPGLGGAVSVTVSGLTSWSAAEVSETVALAGATPQPTVNEYVIIHRMECNYDAASIGPNQGQISATPVVDASVTAYILAGRGQTEMAIYGIPQGYSFHMTKPWGSVNRSITGAVNFDIVYNKNPDVQRVAFNRKGNFSVHSTGETTGDIDYNQTTRGFQGPGILKIQGSGSANNMDVAAGFQGFLVQGAA
jgi:hypothetical protein